MEKEKKIVYFYDREHKTELLGIVTPICNYGKVKDEVQAIARSMLPKHIEEFQILEVRRQHSFGSFLSDMLSCDFHERMNTVRELVQDDEFLCSLNKENDLGFKNGIEVFTPQKIRCLYIVRQYVELCMKEPQLYSFGQFQRLLSILDENTWHLCSLGFFAPIETTCEGLYFFSGGDFPKVGRNKNKYSDIYDLSGVEEYLKHTLLGERRGWHLQGATVEVFECSDIIDVVLVSLFHLIQERMAIKKCANCGKFFVPLTRSDAIYCNRSSPQDDTKTCKEYGSKVLWYENIVSDDVAKLARNIYCSKQMLAKRNADKPEYAKMFEYYKSEKKKWEKQIKAGEKKREEYAEWLRKVKLCKTLSELEES